MHRITVMAALTLALMTAYAAAQQSAAPDRFTLILSPMQVDQVAIAITNGLVKRDADALLIEIQRQVVEQVKAAEAKSKAPAGDQKKK